ncbi:hypothetical protein J6590_015309 [Homalodisca vitripennis]|nr:hypothetical protein J6590_015309 [Homalodisca vitripennis]
MEKFQARSFRRRCGFRRQVDKEGTTGEDSDQIVMTVGQDNVGVELQLQRRMGGVLSEEDTEGNLGNDAEGPGDPSARGADRGDGIARMGQGHDETNSDSDDGLYSANL